MILILLSISNYRVVFVNSLDASKLFFIAFSYSYFYSFYLFLSFSFYSSFVNFITKINIINPKIDPAIISEKYCCKRYSFVIPIKMGKDMKKPLAKNGNLLYVILAIIKLNAVVDAR